MVHDGSTQAQAVEAQLRHLVAHREGNLPALTKEAEGLVVMDTARIRQLLDKRDEIDKEIVGLVTEGPTKERRIQRCSVCGDTAHSARTCPQRQGE